MSTIRKINSDIRREQNLLEIAQATGASNVQTLMDNITVLKQIRNMLLAERSGK